MREKGDVKLDRVAGWLEMSKSEAREWIQGLCKSPTRRLRRRNLPPLGSAGLNFNDVVCAIERVFDNSDSGLEEICRDANLSLVDCRAVLGKAIAKRFKVDSAVLTNALDMIELSCRCPFVDATRRGADGRLRFGTAAEKKQAESLIRTIESAQSKIRSQLKPFVDFPDQDTGLPNVDPWMSSSPWLRELPRESYEPLVRSAEDGLLEPLRRVITESYVRAPDEHRRNAAVILRHVWESAGFEPTTRHDDIQTDYMKFAETIGRLFELQLSHGILESTRLQIETSGIPAIHVAPPQS